MKGALLILGALLGLQTAEHWGDERQPLLIDAQAVDQCGRFHNGAPLPKHRLNPMVNGLDKPNGEIA